MQYLRFSIIFFICFSFNLYAYSQSAHRITYTTPQVLRKNLELPANLKLMKAMNNVDITRHENRFYLGFRTAPSHFASEKTLIHLLSSNDGQRWILEKTIHMGADMREPRFLSFQGKLFFYYFKGGTNPFNFEPQNMYLMERTASGWTAPETFYEPGYVPWRARVSNGRAYLSVYYGRGLYGGQETPAVRLLVSDDGRHWNPISDTPQVALPGAEEPEFEFDEAGNLWGTIRLENHGGMLVYADKDNLADWQTLKVKDKYDSALLMKHQGELYLLARRNLDGTMDKAPRWWSVPLRRWYNLARYSLTPKRTAMYYFDRHKWKIRHMFDFPSHGDTAFPAVAPINANQYLFLNYSSELGLVKDYMWLKGQLKTTRLYSHILTFEPPKP